jgi:hypothetical protein
MAKKGKPLNPYSLGFAQVVAVAETDEQAERDYAPHMDYFYNRCLHVYSGFADAPGYRTISTIRSGLLGQVGSRAALRRDGLTWKDFLEQGYVIAGSPKTVRERLREAMKTLNCGHLMILMQLGSMPPELVRKSTEMFAREVMPHMRDLWTEWEDKWSPHPLPESERAMPAPVDFARLDADGKSVKNGKNGSGKNGKKSKSSRAAHESRSTAK